jgi:hypothetical protein
MKATGGLMKKHLVLLTLASLSVSSFARDRDYGNLVPQDYFSINQSKTSLKNNADISHFQISVTPEKEEFTYKVNDVKTPRKNLFGKKSEFKLNVDRSGGRIERISSVNFSNGENNTHSQTAQSTSLNADGGVDSRTLCSDEFKINIFGLKKKETGFKCVTVNNDVCDYVVKNNIQEEIVGKIKSCSDLLGKLTKFQKDLNDMSKKDQSKDMKALTKLNGRLSDSRNFYEMDPGTLNDVTEIASGYSNAIAQCDYLKENNYFGESEKKTEDKTKKNKSQGSDQ